MQTNENRQNTDKKDITNKDDLVTSKEEKASRKKVKLNENEAAEEDENNYGGMPDTGNFKKFLGCGG